MEYQRKKYLDIAKGIGIILVVWAHANGPGSRYINLFHMPLFFFISGILFNENDSCETFIVKKVKSLYIPFVLWNVLIYFIEYSARIALEGKTFNLDTYISLVFQIEAGVNKASFLGATWFLAALFWITVFYKIIYTYLLNHTEHAEIVMFLLSTFIAIIAFKITFPYFISRTIICSLFYSAGHLTSKLIPMLLAQKGKYWFSGLLFVIFIFINNSNYANMGQNQYNNSICFVIGAFLGTVALIIVSKGIEDFTEKLAQLLECLGKNSITIVIWQFIAFIPVFLIQAVNDNIPLKDILLLLYQQHTYNTEAFGWIWYCITGIFIPVLVGMLLKDTFINKVLKKLYMVR